ncbi:LADA_0C11012g1_1 [Lachancea dasiensis]|uniref:LADA_0C11012g1_1 n=1 Tax=Lachancea dasiensis TaxID=1072105 RepID=A0A1G4J1F6_9SACH|nr:LADA_0C11012g1_1 [Lachancea dasiensis]
MAKRIADSQMTREALDAGRSDDEDDRNSDLHQGFKPASSDIMSKRKIAQPRKRKQMAFGMDNSKGNGESAMANAFSFGAATPASGGFSFGNANQPVPATASATAEGAFSGIKSSTPAADSGDGKTDKSDRNAKHNALNLQFQTKIGEFITRDPCVDLSSAFDQYKRYLEDIRSGAETSASSASKAPAPAPAAKLAPPPAPADASSDSESDDEVKIQGPSFTLTEQPTTKDSVFSFGAKKKRQADSDSESDIEIKGPSFTFESATSAPKSSVFKLESTATPQSQRESATKISASVSAPSEQAQDAAPAAKETSSKFSFGASTTKPALGSNATSQTTAKTSFTFGLPPKEATNTSENKPIASSLFGTVATETKDQQQDIPKPSFSFGQSTSPAQNGSEDKTPSFTFGSSSASKDPSTTGGNKGSEDSSKPKPFTFGKSVTTEKANGEKTIPSFSFGQKPLSQSGNGEKTIPSFSFGQKKDTSSEDGEKPKPTFSFGSSNASTAPSFSFGKPAESTGAPSGGFKFNLPFSSAPSSNQPPKTEAIKKVEDSPAVENEPEVEDSKGISMTNGEEGEELLFSKRAKLMVINPETKAYDSRGVGELKLLRNKDDKTKTRILCRSDGMGHVLLNTSVVKTFQYAAADADKENFIKCPIINGEGKLENYMIRVKQKADGRQFCNSIKEAQDSM